MDLGVPGGFHGRMFCQAEGVAIIVLQEGGAGLGVKLNGVAGRLLLLWDHRCC